MSEREEALWCEVVLLRHRLAKLGADLALRDELIALLKQKLQTDGPVAAFPSAKTVKKTGARKKCDYPPCATQVPIRQRYCSQSHSLKHRWESTKAARAALTQGDSTHAYIAKPAD